MRLGGPISRDWSDPAQWAAAVKASGYSAAYCPVQEAPDETAIEAYRQAAERQDIVIAEVGAWSNPISPDEGTRRAALALCRERLALADRIGARCCVNIAGSRGREWDGPDPRNLSPDTFDRIVESVREIIDGVRPSRTFYTTFLTELDRLDADTPLMLEHLASAEQYDLAAAHIRSVAQDAGVTIL